MKWDFKIVVFNFGVVSKQGFTVQTIYGVVYVIQEDEDLTQDRDFLQQVLENLPGVDPNSEAIQSAMSSLTKDSSKKGDGKEGDKK